MPNYFIANISITNQTNFTYGHIYGPKEYKNSLGYSTTTSLPSSEFSIFKIKNNPQVPALPNLMDPFIVFALRVSYNYNYDF